ncbi:MAG: hypothetical protein IKF72_10170 [Kiritimatiellae bacterium]|nr:hypothetical protein [Kiritimatiellia bacterium]
MKDQDDGQYGYKMIIKDIVRHYPEIFVVDSEQIHFWTKAISQGTVDTFRESFIGFFLMTEKAREVAMNGSVEDIRKYLYQEHITPVQYVFERLNGLRNVGGITTENIKKCMLQNKLVLLHGDEKALLDGKRFTQGDVERLKVIVSTVQSSFVDVDAELAEAKSLKGQSSKSHGSGLFRICKLLVSGVRFVDVNGNTCSDEQLVESLVKDFTEYTT